MEKSIIKFFITGFDSKKVRFYCFELKEERETDVYPFFTGYGALFKGKNMWFEITSQPGTSYCKSFESKKKRIRQLYNYYFKGKFEI